MSDTVLVAVISIVGLTITAAASIIAAVIAAQALTQTKSTHTMINSRMDQLLAEARALSRAEGIAAGEQSQRDRAAPSDGTG